MSTWLKLAAVHLVALLVLVSCASRRPAAPQTVDGLFLSQGCETLSKRESALAAADAPASVLAELEVAHGRLYYSGIWLGMSLAELESHLGHRVFPRQPAISPGKTFALVIVNNRLLRLTFSATNGQTAVDGISLQRMAHEDSSSWTRSSLVEALRKQIPSVEFSPSGHFAEPSEAMDRSPVYVCPGVDGQRVLLKPDEETIHIGYDNACGM